MKLIEMSDYNRPAKLYWWLAVTVGAVTLLLALYQCVALTLAQLGQLLVLLVLACAVGSRPIKIPGTKANVSAGDVFIFVSVVMLGVAPGIVVGVCESIVNAFRASKRASSRISAPAFTAVTVLLAGNAFYLSLQANSGWNTIPLGNAPIGLLRLAAPVLLMAFVQYLLNGMCLTILYGLKNRRSLLEFWREHYLWTSWTFFAAAIAAVLVHQALAQLGLLYVLLGVPVVVVTYATYRVYFDRFNEKAREAEEMSRLHLATVEALATAIDAKDQTTHFHVRRVQLYAGGMARIFGLSPSETAALEAGALLHDIGKLAVPDHILNKPDKLTPAEFEKIKIHTVVGAEILERVGFPYPVVPIVRHHHERWDGTGYPDGLKGEQIPLTARILSVVDSFDTAREDRPYRRAVSIEEATSALLRRSGSSFDPKVVDTFLKNLPEFEREIDACGLTHASNADFDESLAGWRDQNILPSKSEQSTLYLSQIKDAHREVYALYEIARTFGSSLNIQETFSIIANKVQHIVPLDTCVLYLYDEELGVAQPAHVTGKNAEVLRQRQVHRGQGVTGFVLANRHPLHHVEPALDFMSVDLPEGEYSAMASLPMVKDDHVIGALSVYSMELMGYSDDHMRLLETVVRLAADALTNALQHAQAESNALTDPLTAIPNARCLYIRFEQEAARSRRTGRQFQVLMMDLDEFKKVNDTFGHATGDQMLREIAHLLQAQLREYDFLARYAGDEFVAIVPDLMREQVTELCERIERKVVEFALRVRGDHVARVGISVGSATYLQDGETLDQLLIVADKAMYSAKSAHRQKRDAVDAEDDTTSLASTAIN